MKLTIIGAGNMGGAIAVGVAKSGIIAAENITITAKTKETLAKISAIEPKIKTLQDNAAAVKGADLIILAIKPWLFEEVINQIKGELDYNCQSIASVAAGLDFNFLTNLLDNGSGVEPTIYRVVPNTAISLGKSVTYISACRASKKELEQLTTIFNTLGESFVIDESMVGAGTSLASCGIAFALKYIDAAAKGGVGLGFSEHEALHMVIGTMEGALELLKTNNSLPQAEIDKVTTKGGITIKGIEAMNVAGFDNAVNEGLVKSR